jgi:hypothetical protein
MARSSARWAIAMATWAAIGTALGTTARIARGQNDGGEQPQQSLTSGGPIVIGEQHERPNPFFLAPPTGSVDLFSRYETDTSDQGSTHTKTEETLLQESLTVESQGYVYHPNIFSFNIGVTGGLEQDFFNNDNPNTDSRSNDFLYGWDIRGTVLRNEVAPLTLYTRRYEQFVDHDFSPSQRTTDTIYGTNLDIRSDVLPTNLQYYHSTQDVSTLSLGQAYTLDQDVAQWHSEGTPGRNQHLTFDFDFNNNHQVQDTGTTFNVQTIDVNASHTFSFGRNNASNLVSTINYTDQTGDLDYYRIRWDEDLRLKHTDHFETNYSLAVDRESFQGSPQTSYRANGGFIHHLFESLTTTGSVGGVFTDIDNRGEIEQFFSNLAFDYRKNAPLGVLFANLNLGFSRTYSNLNGAPIQVINENHTFVDDQPILLTRPLIDPNTVVVKNIGGIPYTRNLDYTLVDKGNLIDISRILTGLIPPDSPALLDYTVLPVPENTIDTSTLGVGARYDFEKSFLRGFSPYVRYLIQNQSVDSLDPQAVPIDDIRDTIIGGDYHIWRFTLNAEHEWHHSTLLPFEAGRYSARYEDEWTSRIHISLVGGYSQTLYTDLQNHVDTLNATAQLEARITSRLSLLGRVAYLNEHDDLIGNTNGLEEMLEARWKYRQTDVYGRVRNTNLESGPTSQDFLTFELGLKRTF